MISAAFTQFDSVGEDAGERKEDLPRAVPVRLVCMSDQSVFESSSQIGIRTPGFIRGGIYRLGAFGVNRGIALVKVIVFARLFEPEVLGQIGILTAVLRLFAIVGDFGFWQQLLRSPGDDREASRVWSLASVHALALILLLAVAGPAFYGIIPSHIATPIFLLLFGVGTIPLQFPMFMEERDLKYRSFHTQRLAQDVLEVVVTAALQISLGLGLWSYVTGFAISFFSIAAYAWRKGKRGLQFILDRAHARSVYKLGAPYFLLELLSWIIDRGDNLLVAAFWGERQFAFYNLAWHLPKTLALLAGGLEEFLFPWFVRAQEDDAARRTLFLQINRWWAVASAYLGVALFLFARSAVVILYGARWQEAVPALELMTLAFLLQAFWGCGIRSSLMARENVMFVTKRTALTVLALVIVGAPLIYTFGLVGGAAFWCLHSVTIVPLTILPLARREAESLSFLRYSAAVFAVALVSGILTFVIRGRPEGEFWSDLVTAMIYTGIFALLLKLSGRKINSKESLSDAR